MVESISVDRSGISKEWRWAKKEDQILATSGAYRSPVENSSAGWWRITAKWTESKDSKTACKVLTFILIRLQTITV